MPGIGKKLLLGYSSYNLELHHRRVLVLKVRVDTVGNHPCFVIHLAGQFLSMQISSHHARPPKHPNFRDPQDPGEIGWSIVI